MQAVEPGAELEAVLRGWEPVLLSVRVLWFVGLQVDDDFRSEAPDRKRMHSRAAV